MRARGLEMPDNLEGPGVCDLGLSFFLCALEESKNGHGVAMTQVMVLLKPSHDGTCFGGGREHTRFSPALLLG